MDFMLRIPNPKGLSKEATSSSWHYYEEQEATSHNGHRYW